jgi:membrane protease YdiL (CAAX protease family)
MTLSTPSSDSTLPSTGRARSTRRRGDGLYAYAALACGLTWALAFPTALAWRHHAAPSPAAIASEGLSAFGPLLAVLAVAGPRHRLRAVFGRWRTNPMWLALALVAAPAVHTAARALDVALFGEHLGGWFAPPVTSEQLAALVVFPLGEEFGWRGFAYPRIVERLGVVRGALLLGVVWGLWHLVYGITPEAGAFDALEFGAGMIELPLYSVLIAWVFERSNRSMGVALAFHAGAHLDHIERAPGTDLRLHALHLVVLAAVALVAARSLALGSAAKRAW